MATGPRVALRALVAHDVARWLSTSGAEGLRFVEDYPSESATELLRLVALHPVIDPRPGGCVPGLGPWLVVRRGDGLGIGVISCAWTPEPGELSVGYDIAGSQRGQGYATEALGYAVRRLFAQPGVARVSAQTTADHRASRRVMEKAGLRWRRDEPTPGGAVRLVHYAVDRPSLP